jgi:hypothetical protein
VTGASDAPRVTLTGPHGEQIVTPDDRAFDAKYAVIRYPDEHVTYIALKKPAAGTWTVTQQAGSAAVTDLATAAGLPQPSVKATVSGSGQQRTLTYQIAAAAGQTVSFVEQGTGVRKAIGAAKGSHGQIRFKPAAGARGGSRKIVALVERDGVLAHRLVVASYKAPGPPRLKRPGSVKASHKGTTVKVQWGRSAGAAKYLVTLTLSDGRQLSYATKKTALTVKGIFPELGGKLVIAPLGADNSQGAHATGRIPSKKQHGHVISA